MISVGQRLLTSAPLDSPPWVSPIRADARCELRLADIARTGLPDASADVVCLTLVAHELPQSAFREVRAQCPCLNGVYFDARCIVLIQSLRTSGDVACDVEGHGPGAQPLARCSTCSRIDYLAPT
eukprot:scaffold52813_cov41-Tisochrysis_lutea.AAC.3